MFKEATNARDVGTENEKWHNLDTLSKMILDKITVVPNFQSRLISHYFNLQ